MSPNRNRLLWLLVPALLMTAAAWTTAAASDRWAPSTYTDPVTFAGPTIDPASGEPDVGGTPAPVTKTNGCRVSAPTRTVVDSPWPQLPTWMRLALRTWSVWFRGLS